MGKFARHIKLWRLSLARLFYAWTLKITFRLEKIVKAEQFTALDLNPDDLLKPDDEVNPEASYYVVNLTDSTYLLYIQSGDGVKQYELFPSISPQSMATLPGRLVRTPEVSAAEMQGQIAVFKKFNIFAYTQNCMKRQADIQKNSQDRINRLLGDPYQREAAEESGNDYVTRLVNHDYPDLYKNLVKIAQNAKRADIEDYGNKGDNDIADKWQADFNKNVK